MMRGGEGLKAMRNFKWSLGGSVYRVVSAIDRRYSCSNRQVFCWLVFFVLCFYILRSLAVCLHFTLSDDFHLFFWHSIAATRGKASFFFCLTNLVSHPDIHTQLPGIWLSLYPYTTYYTLNTHQTFLTYLIFIKKCTITDHC